MWAAPLILESSTWNHTLQGIVSSLFPWPTIAALVFLVLAFNRQAAGRLTAILRPFRSIKAFGAEVVLTEEGAKELETAADVAFASYRRQVNREFDRLARSLGLRKKLDEVLNSPEVMKFLPKDEFRCTIHVPDLLFDETLYQLLDYYPSGKGRGRTWSTRFGIIGRAWRLGESLEDGAVPTEPSKLMSDWGVNREEAAAAGRERSSFFCGVLKDNKQTPVGIIYLDSKGQGAFSQKGADGSRLEDAVLNKCKERDLTSALASLGESVRNVGPLISIYD